jgi:uncharacterized membrane protein
MTGMAITSLSLILLSVIIIILGIVKVHTLPGQVAEQRGHPQVTAIEVCSLLGLLVFPLWMFALVWAYAGAIGAPLDDRSDLFGQPRGEMPPAETPEGDDGD